MGAAAQLPKIRVRPWADDPEILLGRSRIASGQMDGVSEDFDRATNGRPGGIVGDQKGFALLRNKGQRGFPRVTRAAVESSRQMLWVPNFYEPSIGCNLDKSHRRYTKMSAHEDNVLHGGSHGTPETTTRRPANA